METLHIWIAGAGVLGSAVTFVVALMILNAQLKSERRQDQIKADLLKQQAEVEGRLLASQGMITSDLRDHITRDDMRFDNSEKRDHATDLTLERIERRLEARPS